MEMYRLKSHGPIIVPFMCIAWVALVTTAIAPQSGFGQTVGIASPVVDEPVGSGFKQLSRFGSDISSFQTQGVNSAADSPASSSPNGQDSLDPPQPPQSVLNQDRVNSIQERLKLLQKFLEQEKASADAAKITNQSPTSKPPLATSKPGLPEQLKPEQSAEEASTNLPDDEPETNPSTLPTKPRSELTGTPVTAQPINSFELGNSLFLTGNLSAARKSYEARLKDAQSPLEDAWLRCLIGSCYRLEGDFAKAEMMYREVTRHKGQSYPVDYAKWCLQYIEQKRNTRDQFRVIESEIEVILKELQKK